MQAYAPRDPLAEYWRGELSLRQLRVMVEWLPVDSPAHRAENGHSWRDEHVLAWDIDSQLRVLNTALANLFREKGATPAQPEFIPSPIHGERGDDEGVDEGEQLEIRSNMERLWGT